MLQSTNVHLMNTHLQMNNSGKKSENKKNFSGRNILLKYGLEITAIVCFKFDSLIDAGEMFTWNTQNCPLFGYIHAEKEHILATARFSFFHCQLTNLG